MKKNYLYYIFIVGLVIFNLSVLKNDRANDMLEKYILHAGKRIALLEMEKDAIEIRRMNEQSLNGILINLLDTVYDGEGNIHTLKEIIGKRKIILRFSDVNCQTCIDEQVKLLMSFADSVQNNIVLLTTFQSLKYMKRFKKIANLKMDIYNLSKSLGNKLIDVGIPYFVILDNISSRLTNVFITSNKSKEQTCMYFDYIKRNYFIE